MKKIKYLILLMAIFMSFPFDVLATSSLISEINASMEGKENLWIPIYASHIEEDKIESIYDIANYRAKTNKNLKENITILSIIYSVGVIIGILVDIVI